MGRKILFITTDQQRFDSIGANGGTIARTPVADRLAAEGVNYTPLLLPDEESITTSFAEGACDGYTTDKSGLASFLVTTDNPDDYQILEETMSKEPLGPSVRSGDSQWRDIVNWVVFATIQAEEFGITSENVEQRLNSRDPEIQRFLGQPVEGEAFDPGLGLPTDFAVQVIRAVGNYAEIFDRNVGPDTGLGLERGNNALWTDGGLHYPPPYR